ncbi:MAG TPA: flavin reductase family protein [Nitrospiria bacterium]|nr:flavin reductase family protein [Nitrospiria bacterium]
MDIDPQSLSPSDAYDFVVSLVIPRPIALITTTSPEGVPNAAPFSFFNAVATNPPHVVFSSDRWKGKKKGTIINIEASKEFVVNIVDEALADGMARTADTHPPGTNKIEAAGLNIKPAKTVGTPRIAEAPVALECRLVSLQLLDEAAVDLVIGRVENFYIRDDLVKNGKVDPKDLHAIGGIGLSNYVTTRDIFNIPNTGS